MSSLVPKMLSISIFFSKVFLKMFYFNNKFDVRTDHFIWCVTWLSSRKSRPYIQCSLLTTTNESMELTNSIWFKVIQWASMFEDELKSGFFLIPPHYQVADTVDRQTDRDIEIFRYLYLLLSIHSSILSQHQRLHNSALNYVYTH